MIHEQFYRELGKYLYAMARADGSIQDKERKMLEKTVSEELDLVSHTDKEFQYKEVTLSKLSFYNCIRENTDVSEARNSFLDFIREHSGRIDAHERRIAIRLIRRIGEAYKGTSSAEGTLETDAEKYLLG